VYRGIRIWTKLVGGVASGEDESGGLTRYGGIDSVIGWAELCRRCFFGVCAVVGGRALVHL